MQLQGHNIIGSLVFTHQRWDVETNRADKLAPCLSDHLVLDHYFYHNLKETRLQPHRSLSEICRYDEVRQLHSIFIKHTCLVASCQSEPLPTVCSTAINVVAAEDDWRPDLPPSIQLSCGGDWSAGRDCSQVRVMRETGRVSAVRAAGLIK